MGNWLKSILENAATEIEKEKLSDYYFSVTAISNIPLVHFPGFSEKECKRVQEMSKEVMRLSKNRNNYKEVCISYRKDSENDEENIIVFGDYNKVPFMDNEQLRTLIEQMNKENNVVIVSIHNHPNNSNFSINDLLVFSVNPSIKLMVIINKEGNISFLERNSNRDLNNIVSRTITEFVPDYNERVNKLKKESFSIADLIPDVHTRKEIYKESIKGLQQNGVLYSGYIDKDIEISYPNTIIGSEQEYIDSCKINSPLEDIYEYEENEEDGDEIGN